ncbi:spore germination protein [Bacillus sp. OTU530]|uniref:spore germination protein n=1 Tax=Bacillus sp. OTU530 TaxID=3043862 RepID=UPI00313CA6BB
MKLFKGFGHQTEENKPTEGERTNHTPIPLDENLVSNMKKIRAAFAKSSDIVIREVVVGNKYKRRLVLIYTDGLVNTQVIDESILEPLTVHMEEKFDDIQTQSAEKVFQFLYTSVVASGGIKSVKDFSELFVEVLSGNTVILTEDYHKALSISTPGWKDRGVGETEVQNVIRGSREAFSETIRTNTALVRRRIKDENLCCEQQILGRKTKTTIVIMYIQGVVEEGVIQEVKERLGRIDIDGILESGYIEEMIQDESLTPFPTVYNTERPDVVAANLLEGRVAILVDGTPFVLLVPAIFGQFFQAPEDYYQRPDIATLIRIIRYASFFIALLGPSLYIAVTTFHQEMLPTQLLISLAAQREGVPFPAFVEACVMEVTFEILREAGIRMPRPMGQATSIVGALVIGQSAVEAGFISAAMVIVVSVTAISNFVFPAYDMAISVRMLRFVMMMFAASFGLFGITMALLALVLHLCSLRSFGVPYMSAFAPFDRAGQKDMIMRAPLWSMRKRPSMLTKRNKTRNTTPKPEKPGPTD